MLGEVELGKAATVLGNSYWVVSEAQPVGLNGVHHCLRVFLPKA